AGRRIASERGGFTVLFLCVSVSLSGRRPGRTTLSPGDDDQWSAQTELARARRPRAPALFGENALGHHDLLLTGGEVRARRESAATETRPRRRQELESSEEPVPGIDAPFPAALALREPVPHAVTEAAVAAAADDGDESRRRRGPTAPRLDVHSALPGGGLEAEPSVGEERRRAGRRGVTRKPPAPGRREVVARLSGHGKRRKRPPAPWGNKLPRGPRGVDNRRSPPPAPRAQLRPHGAARTG